MSEDQMMDWKLNIMNTQESYKKALVLYDRFATDWLHIYPGLKPSSALKMEDLQGIPRRILLRKFGYWLLLAKNLQTKDLFATGSAPQFLLSFFAHYIGGNPELKAEKELWFDEFHYNVKHMAHEMN